MLNKFRKSEEGFTLIELLIVVAIIGILAAIAIPQFAAYRVRSFNSATSSDLRNMALSQSTLFTDWRTFGLTADVAALGAPAGGVGAGGVCLGGNANVDTITGNDTAGNAQELQIPISSGVSIVSSTAGGGAQFITIAKHLQGDTYMATDGDTTNFYAERAAGFAGIALAAGDEGAANTGGDDYQGVNGPGGTPWVVQ